MGDSGGQKERWRLLGGLSTRKIAQLSYFSFVRTDLVPNLIISLPVQLSNGIVCGLLEHTFSFAVGHIREGTRFFLEMIQIVLRKCFPMILQFASAGPSQVSKGVYGCPAGQPVEQAKNSPYLLRSGCSSTS